MQTPSLVLLIFLLSSCSTKRTEYQKFQKDDGGYSDRILDGELRAVRFEGNHKTRRSYAEIFARFRALEICQADGKLSHVLGVIDKSSTKRVLRSDGNFWGPSYYYGLSTSPFYSRYGGFGFSTGINMTNSRTWEETLVYPEIEVIFHCTEKAFEPSLTLRDVPPEEMKHLVKDLKGGIQVEGSGTTELLVGDIILRAQDARITRGHQLLAKLKDGPGSISVEILRDGKRLTSRLGSRDVTSEVKKNLEELQDKGCEFDDVREKSKLCRER